LRKNNYRAENFPQQWVRGNFGRVHQHSDGLVAVRAIDEVDKALHKNIRLFLALDECGLVRLEVAQPPD
jgi:hypothetical protein